MDDGAGGTSLYGNSFVCWMKLSSSFCSSAETMQLISFTGVWLEKEFPLMLFICWNIWDRNKKCVQGGAPFCFIHINGESAETSVFKERCTGCLLIQHVFFQSLVLAATLARLAFSAPNGFNVSNSVRARRLCWGNNAHSVFWQGIHLQSQKICVRIPPVVALCVHAHNMYIQSSINFHYNYQLSNYLGCANNN